MKHTEMNDEQKLAIYHQIETVLQNAELAKDLQLGSPTQCGVGHILKMYSTADTHIYALREWYAYIIGNPVWGAEPCIRSIQAMIDCSPFEKEELKKLSDAFERVWEDPIRNLLDTIALIFNITIPSNESTPDLLDPVVDPQL